MGIIKEWVGFEMWVKHEHKISTGNTESLNKHVDHKFIVHYLLRRLQKGLKQRNLLRFGCTSAQAGRKGVQLWMSLQPISKNRAQRKSLDATEWFGATSRPIRVQFYRFWLIASVNIVKDVVEVIVIRGIYILISSRQGTGDTTASFWLWYPPPVQQQQQLGACSLASWQQCRQGRSPDVSTKVLCLSHVHVPVQYKLTKCLVEPRPDPQLQGTDLALKAEPGQYSLTSQVRS